MNRAERIALAIRRSGKKNGQIATECGVTPSSVSQWKSGLTQSMKPENLAALAKATGASMLWLATGEGDMPQMATRNIEGTDSGATHSAADSYDTVRIDSMRTQRLPVIPRSQVGQIGVVALEALDIARFIESPFPSSPGAFLLEVGSESMSPEFRAGQIIQVDPAAPARNGSLVVVALTDGGTMFRRLVDSEDGRILQAMNPQWPDRLLPFPADARIVGVVVGAWMSYI